MIELATELRWQDRRFHIPVERILLSEKVGYDAVFAPEAFGAECFVPAGYLASITRHIKVGTRIMQVTARPPSVAIEAFQGLNHLTGGNRVIAGLGSGTPTQREGLEGQPWGNPVKRMRDYVTLLRQGFAGQPLDHQGTEYSAPYRGEHALGLAPMKNTLDIISDIPIMFAAAHPQMVTLAGEIADGWMPPAWAPGAMQGFQPLLEQGFARAGGGKSLKDFKIWAHVDMIVDDDVRRAMRPFKEYVVTFAYLMKELMESRGYHGLADTLIDMLDKGKTESSIFSGETPLKGKAWEQALDTVPDEYIDGGWLVGPVDRIRERVKPWFDCGLTGLIVRQGGPLSLDPVVENLDAYVAIAEVAGKEPRA